jgi:hypothetical protein
MAKCAHVENKGLKCCSAFCPRGLYLSDWIELTEEKPKCSYIRSDKWKPKGDPEAE